MPTIHPPKTTVQLQSILVSIGPNYFYISIINATTFKKNKL
jgi:hypothetical protein